MQMTREEFDREKRYQLLMHQVKKMLWTGLITEAEFCEIDSKYRLKYQPKTGGLLVKKDLIIQRKRVINGVEGGLKDEENKHY